MATVPALTDTKAEFDTQTTNRNTRSDKAIANATNFLANLRDAALAAVPQTDFINPSNAWISTQLLTALSPARPTTEIDEIKNRIAVKPASDFTTTSYSTNYPTVDEKQISKPDVSIPDAPTFTKEVSADKPSIAEPTNASTPTESVPNKLTNIGNYTIPSPVAVVVPDFGEALPAYTLQVPTTQFAYVEPEYTSALKDALATKLKSDVENGGTGLSSAVEDAIWERTRERDNRDYEDAVDKVNSLWAGKGFSLPNGVLAELQQDLAIDDRNQRTERSRDILIKQAELAQANTHFAITSSLGLEQLELNHANQIYNRALEAEKSVVEFGIAYHNLKIADYNAQLDRYKAQAVEVTARLDAEKLRLESYRNQLLESQAKGELDKNLLAEYNLDLERYDKLIKLFTAEQGAVATALGIEGLKIDFYKENINDYRARIESQSKEFESHNATVQGELGKVKIYEAELDAEKTRVGTLKVQTDIEIAKLNENVRLQELDLKAFVANIEKYKAEAGIANTELQTQSALYGHDIGKYRSEVDKEKAQASLNIEAVTKGLALEAQNANIRLENAKANLQATLSTMELKLESAKSIGSLYMGMVSAIESGFSTIATIESAALSRENTES